MSPEDPKILALVGAVSDGQRVDWDAEAAGAIADDQRAMVRSLRIVASVAEAHRVVDSRSAGRWGHLEILERIGQGAFGEVFRARDPRLDREVALKLMAQESVTTALASSIIEEGRLLARVRHPNVAMVHGADKLEGRVGIWMEFIHGRTLSDLLREHGPFSAREASLIGLDLCRALTAVHKAGVLHRDVKAENAMREEGGRIVLTDFGAGRQALESGDDREPRTISGTPLYMAPETLANGTSSVRSDLYSLGVLLFHLVTDAFPVDGSSLSELREKQRRGDVRLLREVRPDLPEAFVTLVERCLAAKPEERFQSAGQMERALSSALGTESASTAVTPEHGAASRIRRPVVWLGLGLVAAGVLATGVFLVPAFKNSRGTDSPSKNGPEAGNRAGPEAGPSDAYTIQALLYRVRAGSKDRDRLEPGARLSLGDHLSLEVRASRPLHVYVIDEDDVGHAYALFPLPGLNPGNPLAANATHVLPGTREGKHLSWIVDSSGGREHLMVLASPTRLTEFEAEMNSLARPGQTAVSIPETARLHLRGIGGLGETRTPKGEKGAAHLFEMAERLTSGSETVHGVWMRRIELENPMPR